MLSPASTLVLIRVLGAVAACVYINTARPLSLYYQKTRGNKKYYEARYVPLANFVLLCSRVCSGPGVCVSAGEITCATASSYTQDELRVHDQSSCGVIV